MIFILEERVVVELFFASITCPVLRPKMLVNPVAYFDGAGRLPVRVISATLPTVKCYRMTFR
jgi:hypothetical protein